LKDRRVQPLIEVFPFVEGALSPNNVSKLGFERKAQKQRTKELLIYSGLHYKSTSGSEVEQGGSEAPPRRGR
jgi:hypothetical protein